MDRDAVPLVLLPGLDGTGHLFAPLAAALDEEISPSVVSYPRDAGLTYDELEPLAAAALPRSRYLLLAESFSGPVAIRLAARAGPELLGLVLAASFVTSPVGAAWLRFLVAAPMFRATPRALVRALLTGEGASEELVSAVSSSIRAVSPHVLAARLRQVLAADERAALARCEVPILVLSAKRDRLVGARSAELIRRIARGATVEHIDAAHLVLQTRPEEAAEHIGSLLGRVVAKRTATP
jgi:pimeloyl-[acyl-carrier protein] methyl ester esterase